MAMSSSAVVVVVFSGMSMLCFFVAFAVQDWGESKVGPQTGGKTDATVGTYVTDYLLGLECFAMAVAAPGTGFAKGSIAVAYTVGGISWIAGGVLHHIFPTPSQMHVLMWIVALIFGGWSSLLRAYALIVTAQASGKCTCCDLKVLNIVVGAIAIIFAVTVPISVLNEAFPVADWMLLAMKKMVMDLAFIITGFATCEIPWSFACLATMVFFVGLNVFKFAPFIYSTTFNDNSLFHSGVMLFLAMTCGLFNSLAQASKGLLEVATGVE